MFEIIRILFIAFIVAQVLLILAHPHIRAKLSQKALNFMLGVEICLVLAYAVYTIIHFFSTATLRMPGALIGGAFVRCLAAVFEVILCVAAWHLLQNHTVQKDKIYKMFGLSAVKVTPNTYSVYGKIHEGMFDFDVRAIISDSAYMVLSAAGYFDKAGSQKELQVTYKGIITDSDEYHAEVEVTVLPSELYPKD